MEKIFIGIDPDVEGSGVAILKMDRGVGSLMNAKIEITASNMLFPDLIVFFKKIKDEGSDVKVIVEAGWKNHSNWHLPDKGGKKVAAEIGRRTGRNHQIAIDIADVARFIGLDVVERLPYPKMWHGQDGKISHDEIRQITGIKRGRTNQEERDAIMLAWYESNLPIRVKI